MSKAGAPGWLDTHGGLAWRQSLSAATQVSRAFLGLGGPAEGLSHPQVAAPAAKDTIATDHYPHLVTASSQKMRKN
ncbi:MAG: hypothetical protein HKM02_11430 [Pseudomonadales bacterium]|nr:hypothetical protein [Pseudomonadales bacterium]